MLSRGTARRLGPALLAGPQGVRVAASQCVEPISQFPGGCCLRRGETHKRRQSADLSHRPQRRIARPVAKVVSVSTHELVNRRLVEAEACRGQGGGEVDFPWPEANRIP